MIGVLGITGYFRGIWKSIEMLTRKQIRLNDGRFCLPSNEIVWLSLEMPTSQYMLLGSNVSSRSNLFDDSVWKLKHLKLNRSVTPFPRQSCLWNQQIFTSSTLPQFFHSNFQSWSDFLWPFCEPSQSRALTGQGWWWKVCTFGKKFKKSVNQCGQFHFLFSS